jgi:hypothetical protein
MLFAELTDGQITAIVTAVVGLITAATALIHSILDARKNAKVQQQLTEKGILPK